MTRPSTMLTIDHARYLRDRRHRRPPPAASTASSPVTASFPRLGVAVLNDLEET